MGNILTGIGSILKPWGAVSIHQRMINENEVKRQRHINDIHLRVSTNDSDILEQRMHILSLNFFELRDELQNDSLTAVDVLNAFVWKAEMVQREINCVIDFLDESFEQAKNLDARWNNVSGKPPLFGMPFSVKGNFHMKGYDCTIGLAKFLQNPMENDCTLVTFLRSQGAIPFVMTTVPQGLLSFACCSSLYGITSNPHSHSRTPGGSSGGDCALFVAGGSTFGTGSDLAGSLRIPASFCGATTLKPTEGRLRTNYTLNGCSGKARLSLGYGFFTKTVDEQIFLLKILLGSAEYHELVPHQPLFPLNGNKLTVANSRHLRIGYFVEDGFMKPVPACSRVVVQTVEKLRELGHELVLFHLPDPEHAASLFYRGILPYGREQLLQIYANEVIPPLLRTFVFLLKLPLLLCSIISYVLSFISTPLSIVSGSYIRNLQDLQITQKLTDQYIEKFTEQWKTFELDALICPAFAVPAVPHAYPSRLGTCAFATGLFNLLDFPAGIVPTGTVNSDDDRLLADEAFWHTGIDFALKILRDAARDSAGLPVAVQVATLPLEEEKCLSVMKEIEKVWRK
ncbi:amidase, putative [Brugia malayi]|uniref:Amidase, putative n=1 Tax=Brugia malayi TaxID=6279 RepID=A0A0H5S2D5_BRUMA|nr:amidase, putative [Brugia malayi]CRZ22369.1 Bm6873 [Brugia malayi]VIO87637.1 amidase, putative [Brugia malayi]